MRGLWYRIKAAWHQFWVNPESERTRIGQLEQHCSDCGQPYEGDFHTYCPARMG